jgi:drug/metabolite transporter (DMT)-like permease
LGFGNLKGVKASVLTLLYAPFSMVFAYFIFGELVHINEIVGAALILVACYLSSQ